MQNSGSGVVTRGLDSQDINIFIQYRSIACGGHKSFRQI
jgi:hypothetical protein